MPPEDPQNSDGDSDDEDMPHDINHLSRGLLSADDEAKVTRVNESKETVSQPYDEQDQNESSGVETDQKVTKATEDGTDQFHP